MNVPVGHDYYNPSTETDADVGFSFILHNMLPISAAELDLVAD
jgi:hypothetical protein